jgi:hypothetical protein
VVVVVRVSGGERGRMEDLDVLLLLLQELLLLWLLL